MARGGGGDNDETGKKAKKPKRTGPSLLQLEREKYTKGGAASRKKEKKEDVDLGDALAGFRAKLFAAGTEEPKEKADDDERDPTMYGILLDDADGDVSGHERIWRLGLERGLTVPLLYLAGRRVAVALAPVPQGRHDGPAHRRRVRRARSPRQEQPLLVRDAGEEEQPAQVPGRARGRLGPDWGWRGQTRRGEWQGRQQAEGGWPAGRRPVWWREGRRAEAE